MTSSSHGENSVKLQSSFVGETNALGVLYALMYIRNGTVDCLKSSYFPVKKEEAQNGVVIDGITTGSYVVLAYDIEYNGYLQNNGLPSDTDKIQLNGFHTG